MIKRERFIPYLQKLEKAYAPKLHFTQDLVDLWYEMFEDCEEDGLKLAIDKCIKENEFAPNIATVMKYYTALDLERNDLKETIKHQYTTMRSIWGEEYDKETYYEIVRYIMRYPKDMRKVEMIELQQRACSFSHDCDACGRIDKPTIKEYVQGKR